MKRQHPAGSLSWSFIIVFVAATFGLGRGELVLFDRLSSAGHDAAARLSEAAFAIGTIAAAARVASDLWASLVAQLLAARRAREARQSSPSSGA